MILCETLTTVSHCLPTLLLQFTVSVAVDKHCELYFKHSMRCIFAISWT